MAKSATNQEETDQTLSAEAEQLLIRYGEYLYQTSGLDVTTARSYLRAVTELATWREAASQKAFQPKAVTRTVLRQYIDHLHQVRKLKYTTVQGRISGLKYYFSWLAENGMIEEGDDPTRGLKVPRTHKRKAVFDQQITIRVTTPMWNHLRTLAGGEREIPGIVREAVRDYLDEQADLAGSRRSHAKGLQSEIDRLDWYLTLMIILVAQIGSLILARLASSEEEVEQFKPAALLGKAHETARQSGLRVRAGMDQLAEEGKRQQSRQQLQRIKQK